ncbi:MAG: sensor domain-containing diguanylate cyclase [Steroidobacteraceae bacterium]|jgi:diguanylate cyclase (GGDEF)-like protein|nr:sensor domain-containing diguanylate cyclase [Steroidobacteraceae bacterium]
MTNHRFLRTETMRLSELQLRDLVNTPLEARFNRLARLAREAMHVRAAAVSFLDPEREWFKAVTGWNVAELPRHRSLAARLLEDGGPVVIEDTLRDERTRDHALVTGAPAFRFCALYPLKDCFDNLLGAIAAYDIEPRAAAAQLARTLEDVGQLAQRELFVSELGAAQQALLEKLDASRRHALLDELTRLWNRRGGLTLLERTLKEAPRGERLGLCVVDVDNFKAINDRFGHATGDAVLRKVASVLVDCIRPNDIACRLGGDEFLLVLPGLGSAEIGAVLERIRANAEAMSVRTRSGLAEVTLSVGGVACPASAGNSAEDLLHHADKALYEAKASGRNRAIVMEPPRAA